MTLNQTRKVGVHKLWKFLIAMLVVSCQTETFNIHTCRECLFNRADGLGTFTLVKYDENDEYINVSFVNGWEYALTGDSTSFDVDLGNGHTLFLKLIADVNRGKVKLFMAGHNGGFEEINIDKRKSKLVVSTESNGRFQVSGLIEGVIFIDEPERNVQSRFRYLYSFYAVKNEVE